MRVLCIALWETISGDAERSCVEINTVLGKKDMVIGLNEI